MRLICIFDFAGVPQVEVTFQLDANGILTVSAKDKGTQKEEAITITNDRNRLSPEDIQKMMDEAEQFAQEDKLVKERAEAKIALESYAYTLKRQVEDHNEPLAQKIGDADREAILSIIEEKLQWLGENDEAATEDFKEAKKSIENLAQPIIAKLYNDTSNESQNEL